MSQQPLWYASAFEKWLRDRNIFASFDEAADFQEKAVGRDRYKLVDLAVEYVKEAGGTYNSMVSRYSSVRSYFLHRRVELPKVQIDFTPTRDASVSRLNVSAFRLLVDEAGLREKAVYLTLFQGMCNQKRFFTLFNKKGYELACHIKEKGVETPFRIDFLRGRKSNHHPYNSFIGREALTAWQTYFERERGWPKEGEPVALDQRKKALTQRAFSVQHLRRIKRLKFAIEKQNDKSTRYGYNLHELRDLARSTLEKAKEDGFNTNSAEFWMGHTVDKLFYNKIWNIDAEYNIGQYRVAEKHLNILSGSTIRPEVDTDEIVQALIKHPELRQYIRSVTLDMDRIKELVGQNGSKPQLSIESPKNI